MALEISNIREEYMPIKYKELEKTDVEYEETGTSQITHPFDPQDIKIIPETINLGAIIESLENNEIDLSPAFQRKSSLWNNLQKSRLIESLILGLPLPMFFFAKETRQNADTGEKKTMWLVVDGLQRLCTVQEFVIDKKFTLSNLEFLNDTHAGKSYNELTREEQRKIKGARVTTSMIEEGNPPLVKFIIFRRINTGGLTLNEQEIRHALNQGIPATFLSKLAISKEFIKATNNVIKTERMLDREFINRFIAFYLLGYQSGYSGDIELFLANGLTSLNDLSVSKLEEIENAFLRSMDFSYRIFEEDTFRKPRTVESPKRKAISKAVFDTVSVNLAKLTIVELKKLEKNKILFLRKFKSIFINNSEFLDSVSNATGTPNHVYYRFNKIKEIIREVLEK